MRLTAAAALGPARERLEDRALAEPELGLAAVVDGAGGHVTGAVAAPLALAVLRRALARASGPASPEALLAALAEAHRVVGAAEASDGVSLYADPELWAALEPEARQLIGSSLLGRIPLMRMHATAAVAWAAGGACAVAHVGDCRVYRLRGGALERLTRDHSLREETGLADAPGVVTRALGAGPAEPPPAEARAVELRPGDRLVLLTDGAWAPLDPGELARLAAGPIPGAAGALLRAAHQAGGGDDAAAALLHAD